MDFRKNFKDIMNYKPYKRLPLVHFGWWDETIIKWQNEGHIPKEVAEEYFLAVKNGQGDGSHADEKITKLMGFDYNYFNVFFTKSGLSMLHPKFKEKIIHTTNDGYEHRLNREGVVVLHKAGTQGIPAEIDYTLKDRSTWEEFYKPRLKWSEERIDKEEVARLLNEQPNRKVPLGLYCGSVFGQVRDWLGVEGISYLYYDDEELYREIINTVGELQYNLAKYALKTGIEFDFAHFWEDIAYNNGPLITPSVFNEIAGPIYKKITDLLKQNGIDICSLDCDGLIDKLIPTWIENGVNVMFPIEVGIWKGNLKPWREQYGKIIRGVGGMEKNVLARDKAAVDTEIERLKPLVEIGGYIPCIDHRLPPDTDWGLLQYYGEKMRECFG